MQPSVYKLSGAGRRTVHQSGSEPGHGLQTGTLSVDPPSSVTFELSPRSTLGSEASYARP
jgi:hypothetical protein